MTTIRGVKDRRFKFVQLLNEMFEDDKISLKAKGFIGYCLTKTPTWKFQMSHLCSVLKEGEKAIYSTIDECIENGYAYRYQPRDENGQLLSVETVISDSKQEIAEIKKEVESQEWFKKCLPLRPFGDAVDSVPVVASHSNIVSKGICDKQHQQEPAAAEKKETSELGIEYTNSKGEKKSISQSEVFRHFLKFSYETTIITEAIEIMKNEKTPINDCLKFLESICYRLSVKKDTVKKNNETSDYYKNAPPKRMDKPGVGGIKI